MDRFHVAKKPGAVVDHVRKKARAYKKDLPAKDTRAFHITDVGLSKTPTDLSDEGQIKLSQLFDRIPDLELPSPFLWRRIDIFASDISREEAARQLEELRGQMDVDEADDQDHQKLFVTYDEPKSGIVTSLDERRTSGPVEGRNNKARVITKRRYGVRNTQNLWNRLCLDVNLAALAVSFTVTQIHEIASHIRAVYLNYYTWKR